ncbi:hypothetical protein D6C98_05783 [Aureobasidium pullulans]|nr:hypothetical protein D6C98_05783 [Aureobasidium pullulans]
MQVYKVHHFAACWHEEVKDSKGVRVNPNEHNTSAFLGYSGEHIQYPAEETESDNPAAMTENHNAQRQPASPDKVTVQPPTFSSAPPTPPKKALTFIDTNMSSSTPIQSIEQPSPRINEQNDAMLGEHFLIVYVIKTNPGCKLTALDLYKATDFHPMEHPAELKMLTDALFNTTGVTLWQRIPIIATFSNAHGDKEALQSLGFDCDAVFWRTFDVQQMAKQLRPKGKSSPDSRLPASLEWLNAVPDPFFFDLETSIIRIVGEAGGLGHGVATRTMHVDKDPTDHLK